MDRNHYPTRIPGDSEREGNRTRIGRASHEAAIDGPSSNNPCNCKPPRKDFLLSDNPKPRQIAIKPDGEPFILPNRATVIAARAHDWLGSQKM